MELKQQLKQSAGSSTSTVKLPQSSAGDRQACALKKIELKKQQALEVIPLHVHFMCIHEMKTSVLTIYIVSHPSPSSCAYRTASYSISCCENIQE